MVKSKKKIHTLLDFMLVLREEVETQGMLARVDNTDRVSQALGRNNGQDGSKDLVLHDGILERHTRDNGRLNVQVLGISVSSIDNLVLGLDGLQQSLETSVLTLVDDLGVRLVILDVGTEQVLPGTDDVLDQGLLEVLGAKDVIDGETDLATVGGLPACNLLSSLGDVSLRGDDGGALATELEGDGGEVLCGSLHDDTTDLGATGVDDVVEALLEKDRGFLNGTVDNGDDGGVYVFLDEASKELGGVLRVLGGLDDHGVTGSKSACQWLQHQHDGYIWRGMVMGDKTRTRHDVKKKNG